MANEHQVTVEEFKELMLASLKMGFLSQHEYDVEVKRFEAEHAKPTKIQRFQSEFRMRHKPGI